MLLSLLDCPFSYLSRFSVYMLAAYISMFYVENRLLPLHFIIFIIRISWHIYLPMYELFFFLFLSLNSAFSSAFTFFLPRKVKLCSHSCLKIRHGKIVDIFWLLTIVQYHFSVIFLIPLYPQMFSYCFKCNLTFFILAS